MVNNELVAIMKAAESGDPEAQYKLGFAYDKGKGVDRNAEKSVYWLTKAAEQGHVTSQVRLGVIYFRGEEVPIDPVKMVYWFTKAAEQGDETAKDNLRQLRNAGFPC
jgi:TPR repeat protein